MSATSDILTQASKLCSRSVGILNTAIVKERVTRSEIDDVIGDLELAIERLRILRK
jgi:hypothetical protein